MSKGKSEDNQFIITIDLEKIISSSLTIEQFIFLTLLDTKNVSLVRKYLSSLKTPILSNVNQLKELIERKLVHQIDHDNYLFQNFKVTEEFHQLFNNNKIETLQELKAVYPKQTPSGKRKGLQADQAKWGPKYLNIVKNNPKLHELIINCIKYEVADREASGQMEFMPMLSTYINNRRWEVFEEDVLNLLNKGEEINDLNNNNVEDI